MRQNRTLRYYISSCFFMMCCVNVFFAQNDKDAKPADSTAVKLKYGLRLGVDTGKIARSFLDDEYQGIELIGDYRLTERLYIAAEIGNEERTLTTDFLSSFTEGSYIKAGIDYNMYENWLDMDNLVFFGSRIGASTFSHTINEYQVYTDNQYWAPQNIVTDSFEKTDLSAFWLELILGIKAELFSNLYLGLNVQLKIGITETVPDNFENLYIPGFNRTYDSTRIGVGYGYTLSYRIPLYKKAKRQKKKKEDQDDTTKDEESR